MKKLFLTLLCGFAIFIVLLSPQIVTNGVRQGIKLNLTSVIPSLLPFMILTNIMVKYNLCQYISYFFKPVLSKIYKVSSYGCFAIIIGFTCGYPMGAKIIGDLYDSNQISKSEACYLITFCNNCSITFLLNYILFECLGSAMSPCIALLLVYLPPVVAGFVNRFLFSPDINSKVINNNLNFTVSFNPFYNAVKSLSILSVYIICFTVISNLIAAISYIPNIIKCVLAVITEITSGTNLIASSHLDISTRYFLVLAATVFGGFSIIFQSIEQLSDNSIKKYYIFGKLEQLLFFCILYIILHYFSII